MTDRKTAAASRRTILAGGAGLLAAPLIAGRARAQAEVTWNCQSHWPKASASFGDSLVLIADEIEERTGGRMKIELFGAGEFAKGPEIFNIVRNGVVEMGTISPGYIMGDAATAGLALGVPGTLREPWEFAHFLKNMGLEAMFNEDLAPFGVVARAEKVYPTELVVSRPIESVEDFAQLKVRSSGSYLEYLQAAGAAPQFIAGSELYQSLSSGVVDGAHWGAAQGAQSMSLWEVAKYHMKPAMGLAMDTLIMNQGAIDALPDDLRDAFFTVVDTRFWKRTTEYQYKEMVALAAGIAEQNVTVMQFPDGVLEAFATASSDILDAEAAKGGNAAKGVETLRGLLGTLGYA
jgi:TRAP-type mannitol/chloroaromatic compound transport system substrate-binding protein